MKVIKFLFFLCIAGFLSCKTTQNLMNPYETETLKIIPLSPNIFVHITYLQTESFGKVACNGLIFKDKKEVAIFDTPANDTVSAELINWVEKNLKSKVKAIIVNHFHNDCLGGLKEFHKRNISSYANIKTIELAQKNNYEVPKNGFEGKNELIIGNKKVINQFFGEAHTVDNIVSYIPSENTLFGGCMVKEVGASFGFLGDANQKEWSNTVLKVKNNIPNLKYVIPGHGKFGGVELLDYTIEKFKDKK